MSYLPELLIGQRAPLIANRNIPVELRAVAFKGHDGTTSIRHVLVNAVGRVIGLPGPEPRMDGRVTHTARENQLEKATARQLLLVNTHALMELSSTHPTSLLAFAQGNPEKWKDVGDNVGMIDIKLIHPHFLPLNVEGSGLEAASGLRGYGAFQTDLSTDAGQMAYATQLEPMLEKVARLVLEPNGFRTCGNPFMAYIHEGAATHSTGGWVMGR